MIRVEIFAAVILAALLAGGAGVWYAHHEGYRQGQADQQAADAAARRQDRHAQRRLVAQLAQLRQASEQAARQARAALERARGPCLDHPVPGDVVRLLRQSGIAVPASPQPTADGPLSHAGPGG